MTDETPKPAATSDNASAPPEPPPVEDRAAKNETAGARHAVPAKTESAPTDDEYENVDIYTAEVTCKCGRQIAANAWFCPQCGRPYLVNMLFALIVLATGFALLNQLVKYVLSLLSTQGGRPPG